MALTSVVVVGCLRAKDLKAELEEKEAKYEQEKQKEKEKAQGGAGRGRAGSSVETGAVRRDFVKGSADDALDPVCSFFSPELRRLEGVKPLMLKDKEEIQKATQKYDDRDDEADEVDESDLESR